MTDETNRQIGSHPLRKGDPVKMPGGGLGWVGGTTTGDGGLVATVHSAPGCSAPYSIAALHRLYTQEEVDALRRRGTTRSRT